MSMTTIYNPKASRFAKTSTLTLEKLPDVKGAVGGFLSNNKPNADLFLQKLAMKFKQVYHSEFILVNKLNPSYPAKPEFIDQIVKSCKFAVCAIGD